MSHNSVLLERRRQLHERIGGAIETVFADNLEDHLPELARHYSRSANRVKALEFLHRAGEQAIRRGSSSEAESYFAAALEAVPAMPDSPERDAREVRLLSSFAQTLAVTKSWRGPELLEMNSSARALAENTGCLPELVLQLWRAALPSIFGKPRCRLFWCQGEAEQASCGRGKLLGLKPGSTLRLQSRWCWGRLTQHSKWKFRIYLKFDSFIDESLILQGLSLNTTSEHFA